MALGLWLKIALVLLGFIIETYSVLQSVLSNNFVVQETRQEIR